MKLSVNVLHCDNHLLVLSKPAGLLTQPNNTSADSLEAWAKRYLKQRFNKPGNVFCEAVHRLDRPVSGVVLFARTSKALSRLNDAQRAGKFRKTYIAKVEGHPTSGTYIDHLTHAERKALIDPHGKRCELDFTTLASTSNTSLVEIHLKTGRYHQIRAQFAHHGHPIVGDQKYGRGGELLYLHHAKLIFPHPVTHEEQTYSSSPEWGASKELYHVS